MNNYYQCEATSTTRDKTLARESNLPMATMFIYIFIFFAICLIVFIFYRENSNITIHLIIGIDFLIKYGRLIVLLLFFILLCTFITAVVNVSA